MISSFIELLPILPGVLLAATLGALASGLIAPYIVVKRLNMLTGSLAHALVAPVGFSIWLTHTYPRFQGFSLSILLLTATAIALFISYTHLFWKQQKDALLSVIWSAGMAIGLLFLAKTPGSNVEFNDYLFGSLIWLNGQQLTLLIVINLVTIAAILCFYKQFLLICLDEDQAIIAKLPHKILYSLLLVLIALVIVVLMETIGLLLSMTLLTMPALIARCYSKNFIQLHIYSCITSCLMSYAGILTAAALDLPIAPTSALVGTAGYLIALSIKNRH